MGFDPAQATPQEPDFMGSSAILFALQNSWPEIQDATERGRKWIAKDPDIQDWMGPIPSFPDLIPDFHHLQLLQ